VFSLQSWRQIFLAVKCPDDFSNAALSTTLAQITIQLLTNQSDDGRRPNAVRRQRQVIILLSTWSDFVVVCVQHSHVHHKRSGSSDTFVVIVIIIGCY